MAIKSSLDFGMWQPFVKAVWNHELVDRGRNVTAALTSIVAPSYFMPAVVLGKDWGTGTLGTRIKLSPAVAAYATAVAQIGQNNVITYGGQVGLNAAF